jgi:hypothetical protein
MTWTLVLIVWYGIGLDAPMETVRINNFTTKQFCEDAGSKYNKELRTGFKSTYNCVGVQ